MANATATLTVSDYWYDGKREHVVGTVVITNFNYVTGGIPLSFAGQEFIKSATTPVVCLITGVGGFLYSYDYTNLSIRIFSQNGTTGALYETPGGSPLVTGISTDVIKLYAAFKLI